MPTYMSLEWPAKKLRFKINPVGIRKFRYIPYFSGTMLELELVIHNDFEESQDIYFGGALFRLSGVTHQTADLIEQTEGHLTINSKSKVKQKLHIAHLPQPGNYSFRLHLGAGGEDPQDVYGDAAYFDALPKDATVLNVVAIIISGVIGVLIGLLLLGCF